MLRGDSPLVSCYCLTYGRVHLLEEAVECFLKQDYVGSSELIILNDFSQQQIVYNHPRVKVLNLNERYPTMADKSNAAVHFCQGEVLLPWDDDDIYLPHRIRLSVRGLREAEAWRPKRAWSWRADRPLSIGQNQYHAQWALTRSIMEDVGGYPVTEKGEDTKLRGLLGGRLVTEDLPPQDFVFIFRWGMGVYHVSVHGMRGATEWCRENSPVGRVELRPRWDRCYVSDVAKAVAKIGKG